MGALIFLVICYVVYKIWEDNQVSNHDAPNGVDWSKMSRESHMHSQAEQRKLYRTGYYDKK